MTGLNSELHKRAAVRVQSCGHVYVVTVDWSNVKRVPAVWYTRLKALGWNEPLNDDEERALYIGAGLVIVPNSATLARTVATMASHREQPAGRSLIFWKAEKSPTASLW